MSDPTQHRPEPEDLSAQVRRGHASRSDERALQRALTRDPALRVAHQVGLDLDRETSVRAGDEDLILRAADAALARMAPAPAVGNRTRTRWHMVAALALAVVLSGSGIGAALWVSGITVWHKAERANVEHSAPTLPTHRAAKHPLPPSRALAPQPPVPNREVVAAAPAPLAAPARVHHPKQVDAAALFHAANAARRAGELARAKRLYTDLIRQDPSSDEAQLAHVSLGKLLLAQGQASEAEREFQRYLRAGGGPLSEEALFSRAQSLRRLGRLQDEQLAWRALLSAYPDSLYAAEARERLAASNQTDRAP